MTIAPSRGGTRVISAEQMLAYLREHVRIDDDGCRIWAGSYGGRGNPVVTWNHKTYLARRLLAELSGRRIPPGWVAYPACCKSLCMSENCLRIGTRAAMNAYRAKRGQLKYGGTVHALKIAAAHAETARLPMRERFNVRRMRAEKWTWAQIGAHYGVHLSCGQKQWKSWERRFGPAGTWMEPRKEAA